MPERGYFMRLTGAFLIGVVALIIAVAAVFLLAPYILPLIASLLPFVLGTLLVIVAVIIIWILIYLFAMIGVAIYYAIKHPAEVSRESKGYDLDKVKESGRREKGDTDEEDE
ncbi:MAG: hypothetical protein JSV63_03430 [Candidatus Aenigmatarchaeota archaeon]|nr:MAG: hypothetical protein JSV63_03430 [Candidatus Aenigmarchaeota archaeon]